MFVREKTVKTKIRTHTYIQIVESRREEGKVRQRLVCSLGNKEKLDPAAVDRLIQGLARYGTCLTVPRPTSSDVPVSQAADPGVAVRDDRRFGDVFVLNRLWKDLGLRDLFRSFASGRRFAHDLERATFAMVANRLVDPMSKLSVETWLDEEAYLPMDYSLTADHLYRTLRWLDECKEDLEVAIHRRLRKRRLTGASVYFYDTTLTHFEGRGPMGLAQVAGRRGARYGKQHILVGLVTTSDGWPVMHHVYPGAKNDVPTFKHTLEQLYTRFGLREIVVVCDRGMHSEEVVALLEESYDFRYIVATRLRKVKEVNQEVLTRAGRYRQVESGLEVKEVWVEDRRYIICRSGEAAERDTKRRAEIIAQLEEKIGDGKDPGSKAGMRLRTSAYDRFLAIRHGRLVIDRGAVARDERYDGKWVLRTNLRELDPGKVALRYKDESRIERDIQTIKSVAELRPIRHHHEEWVRGHVFVCTLALLLHRYLQERLDLWPANRESVQGVLGQLAKIRAQELRVGKEDDPTTTFWTRSDLTGRQKDLLRRLGVGGIPRNLRPPTCLDDKARERTQRLRERRKKPPRAGTSPDVEVLM